jgi:hypothetical protein
MFVCVLYLPRVEAGKNTSTVIPASRKRRRKGNRISLRSDSASRPKRLMRTYFWISLFMSYKITANWLIESNVILILIKSLKKYLLPRVEAGKNTSTVIPASRKRRQKGNGISLR